MVGNLFKNLLTYDKLPEDGERIIAYCDTADEGNDFLSCIAGVVKNGEGYVTDIYYTQDPMTITQPMTAKFLVDNEVNDAKIESNNGGKGFADEVQRIIWQQYQTRHINIMWFPQLSNKESRIKTGAAFVLKHIYFPENVATRWPKFYLDLIRYQIEGKNQHDDGRIS